MGLWCKKCVALYSVMALLVPLCSSLRCMAPGSEFSMPPQQTPGNTSAGSLTGLAHSRPPLLLPSPQCVSFFLGVSILQSTISYSGLLLMPHIYTICRTSHHPFLVFHLNSSISSCVFLQSRPFHLVSSSNLPADPSDITLCFFSSQPGIDILTFPVLLFQRLAMFCVSMPFCHLRPEFVILSSHSFVLLCVFISLFYAVGARST